ncbi:hypothetical protein FACS189429_8100 [Bacteroidia bacterium]|nr:hypothetical protein FACS189429_8100 [Bacteroidia bacterium]
MKTNQKNIPDFWGDCVIKSNLQLEKISQILSVKLFGGAPFTYGKYSIWEEIPSMYIEDNILGMLIIIGGYGGEKGYVLNVQPYGDFGRYLYDNKIKTERINLDFYLYYLLKGGLKDYPEIEIIEPENI